MRPGKAAQRRQAGNVGMQHTDEVAQQPVGAERSLLIERRQLYVAAIGLVAAEGAEVVVARMFAKQLAIADGVVG